MITDKFKKLTLLVLLISLVLSMAACNDSSNDILQGLIQLEPSESSGEQDDYRAASIYRIIISENSTPELSAIAESLGEKLETATTIGTEVVYDYQTPIYIDGAVEILLGYTARSESTLKLGELRDKDYVIEWYGEKLVIGGKSQDATIDAAEYFLENILPQSTVAVLMRPDQKFGFVGEYDVEEIKLNGFSLSEYKIIYENGSRDLAERFVETVRIQSGYMLDALPVGKYSGGKYISIGAAVDSDIIIESDSAFVGVRKNNVYILGSGENELTAAIESFTEKLFSGEDHIPDEKLTFNYPQIDIQMLSYHNSGDLTISQTNSFTSLVDGFDSAFVLTKEIENDLLKRIVFGVDSFSGIQADVGRSYSIAILYDSSRVSPVGVGKQETFVGGSMIWGEFKTKIDNSSFIIINCYYTGLGSFDGVADKINEITAERDIPFVVAIHNAAGSSLGADVGFDAECIMNRMSKNGYAVYTSSGFSFNKTVGALSTSYGAYCEELEIKKIK